MDACAALSSMSSLLPCLLSFKFSIEFFLKFVSRDNGVKAIENLMKKKGKFDYILLETTGLADPGMLYFTGMHFV